MLWRDSSPSRTIGKLEPSYVIRKFLDAQRIHNLTAYLQTLHLQSLANADHTTLLLNCYTKLKDSSKLEEFIKVMGEGDNLRILFYFVTIKTRQLKRSSANCKLVPVGLLWERHTEKNGFLPRYPCFCCFISKLLVTFSVWLACRSSSNCDGFCQCDYQSTERLLDFLLNTWSVPCMRDTKLSVLWHFSF